MLRPETMYPSFVGFVETVVLPGRRAYPQRRRLDGQRTGGNRTVAGRFLHGGRQWKVHADTHYETLLVAYEAAVKGLNPFQEVPTKSGLSLDLTDDLRQALSEPRFKYLYIYDW
jgi:hypothetical protein